MRVCLRVIPETIPVSVTSMTAQTEVNKDDTNEHDKLDGENPMRPQSHTKN